MSKSPEGLFGGVSEGEAGGEEGLISRWFRLSESARARAKASFAAEMNSARCSGPGRPRPGFEVVVMMSREPGMLAP